MQFLSTGWEEKNAILDDRRGLWEFWGSNLRRLSGNDQYGCMGDRHSHQGLLNYSLSYSFRLPAKR